MMSETLTVRQLSPTIGAIVEGVDLSKTLTPETISAIGNALVTYHVIFFQKQTLTPAIQRDVAAHFGPLHIHPVFPNVPEVPEIIILDKHPGNIPEDNNWHTDVTCIETPPMGSILAAKMLPPTGGDTCWSSSSAAYKALSPAFQAMLDGLTAVHSFTKGSLFVRLTGDQEKYNETARKHPPFTHPVVRVHPVTGEKGLFVNGGYTTHIVELSKPESDAVLNFLFAHISTPEFVVRWRWSEGDVAFWDNRSTEHYALADYLPHRRVMHRATILGDRPRGPNDTKPLTPVKF